MRAEVEEVLPEPSRPPKVTVHGPRVTAVQLQNKWTELNLTWATRSQRKAPNVLGVSDGRAQEEREVIRWAHTSSGDPFVCADPMRDSIIFSEFLSPTLPACCAKIALNPAIGA
jgi:hypothetical protein